MDNETQSLTPFAKAVVEVFDEKNPQKKYKQWSEIEENNKIK